MSVSIPTLRKQHENKSKLLLLFLPERICLTKPAMSTSVMSSVNITLLYKSPPSFLCELYYRLYKLELQ